MGKLAPAHHSGCQSLSQPLPDPGVRSANTDAMFKCQGTMSRRHSKHSPYHILLFALAFRSPGIWFVEKPTAEQDSEDTSF